MPNAIPTAAITNRIGISNRMKRFLGLSSCMAQQRDENALNDKFPGGNQVRVVGVFCPQERSAFFHEIAFQSGFPIDQGSHDVTFSRFAEFENHRIAVADVSVDHRITTDFQGEGAGVAGDSQGSDIDRNTTLALRFHILRHASGDVPKDRDVQDFATIEFFRENDGTGFSRQTLDDSLAFERPEVAHGGGLAGEAEEVLDFPSGWHNARLALRHPEVIQNLLLAVC